MDIMGNLGIHFSMKGRNVEGVAFIVPAGVSPSDKSGPCILNTV